MNTEQARKILQRDLNILVEHKSLPDTIEAMKIAINAIGALGQIQWERDVAISQLEELGLGFGQKVDHIKALIEKDNPKAVVNYDNCGNKCISKRCPDCFEMIGNSYWKYCPECGQRLL